MSDHTQPVPELADIQPTPESVEVARDLVYKVLDDLECPMGRRLVRVIAEHLTRNDRETTRWVNQEIQEKTESLQRAFVKEAERRMDAQLEVEGLKAIIGRGIEQFHGTTWTHDLPKDPAGLEQCIKRLRRTDGVHADAAVIVWEQCQALVREIDRLRARENRGCLN